MKKLYAVMEDWSKVMEPGNTPPVDIIPIFKWIPEQLTGMWRSRAAHVGKEMNELYDDFLNKVIKRREELGPVDCFMDRMLDQQEKTGSDNHATYFMCGNLMEAGSDTSTAIIIAFIKALTK